MVRLLSSTVLESVARASFRNPRVGVKLSGPNITSLEINNRLFRTAVNAHDALGVPYDPTVQALRFGRVLDEQPSSSASRRGGSSRARSSWTVGFDAPWKPGPSQLARVSTRAVFSPVAPP
jgi:hypothetical protein